jgi:hypothetical protein
MFAWNQERSGAKRRGGHAGGPSRRAQLVVAVSIAATMLVGSGYVASPGTGFGGGPVMAGEDLNKCSHRTGHGDNLNECPPPGGGGGTRESPLPSAGNGIRQTNQQERETWDAVLGNHRISLNQSPALDPNSEYSRNKRREGGQSGKPKNEAVELGPIMVYPSGEVDIGEISVTPNGDVYIGDILVAEISEAMLEDAGTCTCEQANQQSDSYSELVWWGGGCAASTAASVVTCLGIVPSLGTSTAGCVVSGGAFVVSCGEFVDGILNKIINKPGSRTLRMNATDAAQPANAAPSQNPSPSGATAAPEASRKAKARKGGKGAKGGKGKKRSMAQVRVSSQDDDNNRAHARANDNEGRSKGHQARGNGHGKGAARGKDNNDRGRRQRNHGKGGKRR